MKKWIFIIVLLLLVIFTGVSINVYVNAVKPVKTAEEKAVVLAKKSTSLSKVNDFHIYHGLESIDVIQGKNKKGENIIVWIPEKSKKVFVRKAKDGLSKNEAIQKLLQEKKPKQIISVRLGMERDIPLWEIYYRSNNNLINYYYIDFETGEWLKKIENL
ncbi:DUF5590 domain-containing protein [Bacillus sp. BRMEA1]|uniref:cell wall elongation regulator TseB-like domain-containing protein n=1 Tax=Neobacillus endophyticus TaxID=2738405 RepID=UPI001564E9C1|nr:DUF5590 domain-containing protein [Neobacillus endophyticus]NRD80544.1 DUF5590 domain-containing protein [Neobacillus endophyticus]